MGVYCRGQPRLQPIYDAVGKAFVFVVEMMLAFDVVDLVGHTDMVGRLMRLTLGRKQRTGGDGAHSCSSILRVGSQDPFNGKYSCK